MSRDASDERGRASQWCPSDWYAASWLPAVEAIEATRLKRADDFKTHGDLYLWTSRKLRELRTTNRQATCTDAAGLLARTPVDRTHRRDTVAARRKPLPRHADSR